MSANAAPIAEQIDLTYERTLKENLQRQLLEIEIALERGDLELLEPIETRYASKAMVCKSEYLAMPEKVRHLIFTEYGIDVDIAYLDEIVSKALTFLAECKGEDLIQSIPTEKFSAG